MIRPTAQKRFTTACVTLLLSFLPGVHLNLFLLADGVTAARRGQKTPTGYYNVADMLSELISKGVKVKT